jgi:energy-coupling factor transporter ATP-binding protein EcfA2
MDAASDVTCHKGTKALYSAGSTVLILGCRNCGKTSLALSTSGYGRGTASETYKDRPCFFVSKNPWTMKEVPMEVMLAVGDKELMECARAWAPPAAATILLDSDASDDVFELLRRIRGMNAAATVVIEAPETLQSNHKDLAAMLQQCTHVAIGRGISKENRAFLMEQLGAERDLLPAAMHGFWLVDVAASSACTASPVRGIRDHYVLGEDRAALKRPERARVSWGAYLRSWLPWGSA